jgi:DNA-directed RNA polymerase specialized sigma24 family protein
MSIDEAMPEISRVIELYRGRWTLADYPFDDLAQDIKLHLIKKWHLFDQTKPLAPWVAGIVQNQIKNELRNRYYIYQPPCLKCEMFLGEGGCKLYGKVSTKCSVYANFLNKKGIASNLYFPVSYEQSNYDATQQFSCSSNEFANHILDVLSGVHKQIFYLFYTSGFSTTKIAKNIRVSGMGFKEKTDFIEDSLATTKEVAKNLIAEKRISMGLDYGNS